MAQQGLMCVWQTISDSNTNIAGPACPKDALQAVNSRFYRVPHIKGSEAVFDEVFGNYSEITLAQYYSFVKDHLRDSTYAMCLIEDEIEQVCWDLTKVSLREQGYPTHQCVKQLWQIFGRLSEVGSLPPVIQNTETEWFIEKMKLDLPTPDHDLTFTALLDLLDVNSLADAEEFPRVRKAIDGVHSWLVKEVLMTGWMWKRTRKQANWTAWLKRWFVLTPGLLAYYDGPKMKVHKGSVDILKKTNVTDMPHTRRFGWRLTGCFGLENRPFLQVELATMDDREKHAWLAALDEVKSAVAAGSTPIRRILTRKRPSGTKSKLLDLRTTTPSSVQHQTSSKAMAAKCTDRKTGQKTQKHISVKEPNRHRKLKKLISIPEHQRQRIRNIFFSIDNDGNGKIDKREFYTFLEKLGLKISQREVDLIFDNIEQKQDGKLTMEGFYVYFVKAILHESSGTPAERRLRTAFLDADRTQTGTIDFREFVEYVWERRRSVRISRVLGMFEEMDSDHDGQVEYKDFLRFMKQDPSFCEEMLCKSSSSDEELSSSSCSENPSSDDETNNNGDDDPGLHLADKELQKLLNDEYIHDDPATLMNLLRKRWQAFASFKRPGASGEIVMAGKSGIVSDVLPGDYSLLDLAAFSDLPPLIPKHAHLTGVLWESADPNNGNSHGRIVFPAHFDGVIPIEIATTELLRYYGCSLANTATMTVSLMYRHAIQDFTYENQYIKEFVSNPQMQAGGGMEKHDFSHLDMPLDDAGGHMVVAKYEDGEMHLTAFIVPTRQCLYMPGGTVHTNDYLTGTWRTMLSDEAPIDHCHIMKKSDSAENGLEKFLFTFK